MNIIIPRWPARRRFDPASAIKLLLVCLGWQFVNCRCELKAQALAPEYEKKAEALIKLLDYVRWPGAGGSSITVGLLGEDPFDGALRTIKIKRSKRIEDLKDCQIIFVPESEKANVRAILEVLGDANILIVGESEGFAKQGGVVGLVMDGGNVCFEINITAARQAGLGIDLRLLRLARHVFSE